MLRSLDITGLFISVPCTSLYILPCLGDWDAELCNKQVLLICPTWQKNKYKEKNLFRILSSTYA